MSIGVNANIRKRNALARKKKNAMKKIAVPKMNVRAVFAIN
ncbi:hypothetical protein [Lysinibacillus fusiformis]|nr:hypothetical protein [Lysinibacillus fusiformis]